MRIPMYKKRVAKLDTVSNQWLSRVKHIADIETDPFNMVINVKFYSRLTKYLDRSQITYIPFETQGVKIKLRTRAQLWK